MSRVVIRPGHRPEAAEIAAVDTISKAVQSAAGFFEADLADRLGSTEAVSAVFSGLISAAATFAMKRDCARSAAESFMLTAVEVRPAGSPDPLTDVTLAVLSLVNILRERGIDDRMVVVALLNAAGNLDATLDVGWIAAAMRDVATQLTDPARREEARARAAALTRPAGATTH